MTTGRNQDLEAEQGASENDDLAEADEAEADLESDVDEVDVEPVVEPELEAEPVVEPELEPEPVVEPELEPEPVVEPEAEPAGEPDWSAQERAAEPAEALAMASAPPHRLEPEVGIAEPVPEVEPLGQLAPEPFVEPDGAPPTWIAEPADYEERWVTTQIGFVDEPRQAVEGADLLLAQVVDEITAAISQERENISIMWRQSGDVSTEDLRLAFQRYRTLFQRLIDR